VITDIASKEIFIFDLDGTLVPSKLNLERETADILVKLLEKKKIAVVSGESPEQFRTQFISHLPLTEHGCENLFILPLTGSQLEIWDGNTWVQRYAEKGIDVEKKENIIKAIHEAVLQAEIEAPEKIYGEQIEDRGTQITFSALGQEAPIEIKSLWDPTHKKRKKVISFLRTLLPNEPIHIGGTTSIDVGWDKGKGLEKFLKEVGIPKEHAVFFGDALYLEGNDHPAQEIGLDCIAVRSPADTRAHLQNVLKLLS
jgi:phosphomannomutase